MLYAYHITYRDNPKCTTARVVELHRTHQPAGGSNIAQQRFSFALFGSKVLPTCAAACHPCPL